MINPPIGALWGIPFLRLAVRVGGGVDGLKLCTLLLIFPWLLLLYESSESNAAMFIPSCLFFLWKFFDVPTICIHNRHLFPLSYNFLTYQTEEGKYMYTLQPREQKRKESTRLRSQTSQVLVTPFPGLGCGLSLRKTILALLIM